MNRPRIFKAPVGWYVAIFSRETGAEVRIKADTLDAAFRKIARLLRRQERPTDD